MGALFVTPQTSKSTKELADPELAQTKEPEPDPDPTLETSDFHQYLKQVSGKNVMKVWKHEGEWKGFDIETAISLSVITGELTNTKEGFTGPKLPENSDGLRSQFDRTKGDIAGVIKTASLNFAEQNWRLNSKGSYGKLFLGLKAYIDGPQLSLNEKEQKVKPFTVQVMIVGRLENPDGVTADVYGTVSLSPKKETTKKMVEKAIQKLNSAATSTQKKIAKGELLRKKMLAIGEAEQKATKKELAKARSKLTRLKNNNARVLRKHLVGILNKKSKTDQKITQLRKLEGVGKGKAEAIVRKYPKGMGIEDKITHVTGIGDKTYAKMQTSKIKGIIPEERLASQLKEAAEEVTKLEIKLVRLSDEMAEITGKAAIELFEKEVALKEGKRTVAKVISAIAAKKGLRIIGRIALHVIPFVNVVMTAWDIIEIGLLLYKNIGNYATGSNQGSMIPHDREKKYQPEDKAPVGITPTVMEQINTAPDPVQRIWSSITHQGAPGNLTDTEAQRFLQIVPKNISEEQADEVIAAMLSEATETPSVALTKLQKIIAALQGTTEDTEVGEQDHLKSRQNTVQRSGGVQQSKEYKSPLSGQHVTKDAKEVRYNGKVGNANAGILTIDNLSKAHLKMEDEKVTLQVTAYDYSGNSYTVTNNEVKIVEIAYYNSKLDEDVVSEAAATHQRVGYEILDGVQFDFPAPSQDGALVTGRIISGYFKLK
ncbi:MAG: hypothetical protein ACFB0B_18175 [Thermonemataceae bacterium]